MIQRLTITIATFLGAITLFVLPSQAMASEVINTDGAVDITDTAHLLSPDENTEVFAFEGEMETTYDIVFSVESEPSLIVTVGADMNGVNDWIFDATAGTLTIPVEYTGIVTDDGDPTNSDKMFIITLTFDTESNNMAGVGMATNMLQWLVISPTPDSPYFGFQLTGTPGTTGYFHMFIPATGIDHLGSISEEDLNAESLAVFVNNQQASMGITEVDGGAYIDLTVTFADNTLGISSESSITKKITAGPKEPVSLIAKKDTLEKGSTAKLYGWIKQEKAGKTVTLYRKLKGEDKFTVWKTVETNKQGYYSIQYTAKKTAQFKAEYKDNSTDKIKVTVE